MTINFSGLWENVSQRLSDEKAKFISTTNVLQGCMNYDSKISNGEEFLEWSARNVVPRKSKSNKEISELASRLLRISWQTELASQIPFKFEDQIMKEVSIQIFPVQAYYAIFNSIRAYSHVIGNPVDSHAGIRKTYSNELSKYANGCWSVSLDGNPEKIEDSHLNNINYSPTRFNPVYGGQDVEGYVWSMLQTARRYNLNHRKDEWLKSKEAIKANGQKRKIIPALARTKLADNEYSTTPLDYLYKLRCDTNYKSVDEFSAENSEQNLEAYYEGLNYLMQSGLFAIETQIAHQVGTKKIQIEFDNWSDKMNRRDEWLTKNPRRRLELITDRS
jgi:hypothetical protein